MKTLQNAVEMYPRYEIAALHEAPKPLRRIRRTREQIKADAERRARPERRAPEPTAESNR